MNKQITESILEKVKLTNFKLMALLAPAEKLQRKHYIVICVEEVLKLALTLGFGLGSSSGIAYIYDGTYWASICKDELKSFLGEVAHRMGISRVDSSFHIFREELYLQFLSLSNLNISPAPKETTLINLSNGTFEVTTQFQKLRAPCSADFLKYRLHFSFNDDAKAPRFNEYLNRVLPDLEAQKVLCEYLGYIFVKPSSLKLEKALMLIGSGANGKSVLFEIISALLGRENICNFSLHKITTHDYSRAMLNGKLLNYATEINGNLDTAVFKQLVSGEPVEARLPYGNPFTLTEYAKLIFNCNELPKDIEHTDAYFRRLIIIPFNVTIPQAEQDTSLAKNIIAEELSGVFNWVLSGLKRLLEQGHFTECDRVRDLIQKYRDEANNVQQYLTESQLVPSTDRYINLRDLYQSYVMSCKDNGYKALSKINFKKRLLHMGITIKEASGSCDAYLARSYEPCAKTIKQPIIIQPVKSLYTAELFDVTEVLEKIIKQPKPLF